MYMFSFEKQLIKKKKKNETGYEKISNTENEK